jgi:DNA-binding CsgD family transcriptional regulator
MPVRYRPMERRDVSECVQIVAAHPIVSARYDNLITHLKPIWLRLLASGSFAGAAVLEEETDKGIRMPGMGASVFVSDDFVREVKAHPHLWIGPELVRRIRRGDSPVLSPSQVRKANSAGGLNVMVWQGCVRMEDNQRSDVWYELTSAFLELHRGFLLKEVIAQAESAEHLLGMRNTGALRWSAVARRYTGLKGDEDVHKMLAVPHVFGLTREVTVTKLGSWGGSLFLYQPPQFVFSPSEQRLLLCGLGGGTDEQIAGQLHVSLDAVRKTWRSIYERAGARLPFVANSQQDRRASERGKQKKHLLLAYLREHPEELRPISRKLLQKNAARPAAAQIPSRPGLNPQ